MAGRSKIAVGDLVASVDAPTLLYRITTKYPAGYFRALPYRRSGSEKFLTWWKGSLIGADARWIVVGRS